MGLTHSEKDIRVATNTIYHAPPYPSYLVLPVLPPQKRYAFEGTARIETPAITYTGPAECYVFPTSVYLNCKDQWIKWKTIKNWQEGAEECYESEGKAGRLSVVVRPKDQAPFDVLAMGPGIYFKGWEK
jgi:hypothetical protein